MVLPKDVREKAGIRTGDKLALISWSRDGDCVLPRAHESREPERDGEGYSRAADAGIREEMRFLEMDKKENTESSCSCTPYSQTHSCSCLTDTSPLSEIRTTDSTITFANRLDHFLARWGWKRESHRVEPGLYRLGNPSPDSPVFASANYTLSFDALRSALTVLMPGSSCWIPKGSMSGVQPEKGPSGRRNWYDGSDVPVFPGLSVTGRSSCPSWGRRAYHGRR